MNILQGEILFNFFCRLFSIVITLGGNKFKHTITDILILPEMNHNFFKVP